MISVDCRKGWWTGWPCCRSCLKTPGLPVQLKVIIVVLLGGKRALSNGLGSKDVLPAKAFHVALYLASVIQTAESASPVIKAFYSIKWFHAMFDL